MYNHIINIDIINKYHYIYNDIDDIYGDNDIIDLLKKDSRKRKREEIEVFIPNKM